MSQIGICAARLLGLRHLCISNSPVEFYHVTQVAHLMNGPAWFWGQELQQAPDDEWHGSRTRVSHRSMFRTWVFVVRLCSTYEFWSFFDYFHWNLKQLIWDEIGQDQIDREKVLLEVEQECLDVYKRKVDSANIARARLHQSLADSEAEFTHLLVSLGERSFPCRVSWFYSFLTQWVDWGLGTLLLSSPKLITNSVWMIICRNPPHELMYLH